MATVEVEGLKQLRRDLKRLGGPEMVKELRLALKEGATLAVPPARAMAPKKSGKLAGSIRPGTSGAKAFIASRVPYAAVQNYGGRVGRKKATLIQGKHFMNNAIDASADQVVEVVGEHIETLSRRLGWKRGI